jgi:hypothetical protein
MLFQLLIDRSSKPIVTLTFSFCAWVLDFNFRRLFLSPVHRELYVCHTDGVAHDILDLAFHLAFGAVL